MPKRPELPKDLFDLPIDAARTEPAPPELDADLPAPEPSDPSPVSEDAPGAAPAAHTAEEANATAARQTSPASEFELGSQLPPAKSSPNLPLFDEVLQEEDRQGQGQGQELGAPGSAGPAAAARAVVPSSSRSSGPPSGIFDQLPDPDRDHQEMLELEGEELAASALEEAPLEPAGFLVRLQAGAADLLAHLAVLSSALVAMKLLGLEPAVDQWPGFVSFLALFSFLYLAFPLAFWGHTPGMAWFGLVARDQGDRPLAFGQTGIRVVASWLTVMLLGLPLFVALSGRSLADRLSQSETWIAERGA